MDPEHERPEDRKSSRTVLVVVLVAALVVLWVVWWQWDAITGRGGPTSPSAGQSGSGTAESASPPGETAAGAAIGAAPALASAQRRWAEALGHAPEWPDDILDPRDCKAAESDLAHLCSMLDERDDVRAAPPAGGTCALLMSVAEELGDHPPEISAELKSYPTIVENVYHLFRVLGRQQFASVSRLLWEEQDLAEPAAMTLYRWAASREACARSGATPLRTEVLYDYAGFLFTTLGGQAYLRRRTPQVEALVSFYALLALDREVEAGYNPAGVDPRREIQRTRALLDEQDLVFHDQYLLVLDQMAERWKARAAAD